MSPASDPSPQPSPSPVDSLPTGGPGRSREGAFYCPELDGLRFVAFIAVYVHHGALLEFLARSLKPVWAEAAFWLAAADYAGGYGVALFFVLSSYLLTSLLLLEGDRRGRIDVVAFWIRRSLRIWPLYFAFLAMAGCWGAYTGSLLPYVFMVGNWSQVCSGYPQGVISHLWSISIEEQFYVVWPLFVLFARRDRRWYVGLLLLSWVLRLLLVQYFHQTGSPSLQVFSNTGVYCNTFTWLDALALGGLAATLPPPSLALFKRGLLALAGFFAWLVVGRYFFEARTGFSELLVGYFLVAAGGTAMLVATVGSAGTFLAKAPMVYLGRISYGLYMFHVPALYVVKQMAGPPSTLAGVLAMNVVGLALTVAVSAVSYRVLEQPFIRMKRSFTYVVSEPVTKATT